ncbi:putative MFS family arabinose efflux permease [Beijerinckia sp. GAS462]|nr:MULTISPECIES: MFS transporter [unclassified Beijerinckia]MDH7798529.1 putative MFS family arabinose efflux permease [Beijerinckia sp. GAS462]
MADVRDGLGPFLGVFLQDRHWSASEIGLVMTIGGLAGMVATTPTGIIVDSTKAKRALAIAAIIAVILSNTVNYLSPTFPTTAVAQTISAIGGAAMGPIIAALTLGLVKQAGFAHQLGRNEAFNHAGNASAAALAGLLGYIFGFVAVFALMSIMAVASVAAVLLIKKSDIDHEAARGRETVTSTPDKTSYSTLLRSRPLIVIAITMALFHLGNAAMLPLLGQAMVARGDQWDPSAYTAATILIAQITMIPMALIAARIAVSRGYNPLFIAALVALPLRGLIAWSFTDPRALIPVQILDGVGAGLLGVALPGIVAQVLWGTGHVNAGIGAVMTAQGVGAAFSTAVAGFAADSWGYGTAFLILSAIALAGLLFWLLNSKFFPPAQTALGTEGPKPSQAAR